jgi:hypothetical protein
MSGNLGRGFALLAFGTTAEGDVRRTTTAPVIAFALAGLSAAPALAAPDPVAEHGSFSILVENDVFYKSDRDYSSGVALAYTTGATDTPAGLVALGRDLTFLLAPGEIRASYEIGQDIFTPANTAAPNPPLNQRPYAGFLWGSLALLSTDERHLNQLQLQLGVVGPLAQGQEAQVFVHSIRGEAKPQGWDFQLRNEPAVQFTYEAAYKLIPPRSALGFVFDLEPHIGAAAGNVYDYVAGGAMLRAGINLPNDFGPLRLDPALPGSNFFQARGGFSAYAFAGVDVRAIARNIFLDGNTWQASRHVDKIPYVGDLQLGAAIELGGVRLSYMHVFRTKEYHGQAVADQFGSINLAFQT